MFYKKFLRKFRNIVNFWLPQWNIEFLNKLRLYELNQIKKFIPKNTKILEIGAGSGFQSKILNSWNNQVEAIDISSSIYKKSIIYDVKTYDGKNIPYPENYFSIIFSSNVFEHILNIKNMLNEISRVTKKGSKIILLMPSPSWRFWTSLTDIVRNWHSRPHGVHSKNIIEEFFFFSKISWKNNLIHNDLKMEQILPNNIFYTGNYIFGKRLPIKARKYLSKIMGSSCNIYILRKIK